MNDFSPYPNEAVCDEIKLSQNYGKTVGKYIENQWFGQDSKFFSRREQLVLLRQHMKGDVDISNFLDVLGIDPDQSFTALNWRPPRIIAKFVNNVVDSFSESIYGIKATGIDPINNTKRVVYTENLRMAMVTQDFTNSFNQQLGVNVGMGGNVPQSNEELELHMNMNYHTLSEAIPEISIRKIMEMNDYAETKKQVDEDLVLHGEGGVRIRRIGERISLERLLPEDMIYGYDNLNSRDCRATPYFGHVRSISVGELKRLASVDGVELTNEDISSVVSASSSFIKQYRDVNNAISSQSDDDDLNVLVVDFCYKTSMHLTYKKKKNKYGGDNLIRRESYYNVKENENVSRVQGVYECWIEGVYVLGTDWLFGYRKMDNQARKQSNLQEPVAPIVYYKLSTESIGSRILPYAENLYVIYMKIQQLVSKLRPDGIALDISALTDIDLMDGTKYTASQLITMFVEEGKLLYDGEKLDGSYNPREPLRTLPAQSGNQLSQLVNLYLHWIQAIRDDTGINEARDASTPSADALVGVQKLSLAASLNSTKHISRGILNITKRVAESVLLHLQLMSRNKVYSKSLMNMIGRYHANALEELIKMGDYEYSIGLELAPTAEEQATFNRELEIALDRGKIEYEDVADIRSVGNIKMARLILKVKTQQRMSAMQQIQAQQQQGSAAIEQQKVQMEVAKDREFAKNKMAIDNNRFAAETRSKMDASRYDLLLQKQYGNPALDEKMQIEEKKHQDRVELETTRQDRLDKRSNRTKTQESKLIDQRTKDSDPQNFEYEDDLFDFSNEI